MSFKLSVDKLFQCDRILSKLEGFYREKDYMGCVSNGNDKSGDRLDDTELLRVFIDTLRKTIDSFPGYNRHTNTMQRANIEYYMYDIAEIHTILEEALRPVFRIDRQETKKKKRIRRQHKKSGRDEALAAMQQADDDEDDPIEGMSSNEEEDDVLAGTNEESKNEFLANIDTSGLSEKEKRTKLKMAMVNKRLDELITVLDTCVADL